MTCIFFINGPPRVGKDFAGMLLSKHVNALQVKFAEILKERTHDLYGLRTITGSHVRADAFDSEKDEPSDLFGGKTPREAYIAVSERYFKPEHGIKVFGLMLLEKMKSYEGASIFAITDSGFAAEAEPVADHYGRENCVLIRLHAPGKIFYDSRSYIDIPGVPTFNVWNPFNEQGLLENLRPILVEAGL